MIPEQTYQEIRELAKKIVADSISNQISAVQVITNVLCDAYEDKLKAQRIPESAEIEKVITDFLNWHGPHVDSYWTDQVKLYVASLSLRENKIV